MESFVRQVKARLNALAKENKTSDANEVITRPFTEVEEETYKEWLSVDRAREETDNEDAPDDEAPAAGAAGAQRAPASPAARTPSTPASPAARTKSGTNNAPAGAAGAADAQRAPASPAARTRSGTSNEQQRNLPPRTQIGESAAAPAGEGDDSDDITRTRL